VFVALINLVRISIIPDKGTCENFGYLAFKQLSRIRKVDKLSCGHSFYIQKAAEKFLHEFLISDII